MLAWETLPHPCAKIAMIMVDHVVECAKQRTAYQSQSTDLPALRHAQRDFLLSFNHMAPVDRALNKALLYFGRKFGSERLLAELRQRALVSRTVLPTPAVIEN